MGKEDLRKKFMEKTAEKLKEAFARKDLLLAKIFRTIETLKKMQNMLKLKLKELAELYGKEPEKIEEKHVKLLVDELKNLSNLIKIMENYQDELAKEVAPNATILIGPKLVARFIGHAKSLERLAEMPASALQVYGAEKALFKHLKSKRKVKPPKHGFLFLSPFVNSLPKKKRGKMARFLANKLCLAFKADYFTKSQIGETLREEVEKKYKELKGGE